MNRRLFFTRLGLGLLASISLDRIAALTDRSQSLANDVPAKAKSLVLYVAPNGDDRYSGRHKSLQPKIGRGPFATIERAQQEIRQSIVQSGGLKQPVTVLIRGGTYYLDKPLQFTVKDSGTAAYPIVYRAFPKETPIISGGKPIADWEPRGKKGHLWASNLPEVRSGDWYFRTLRVGSRWGNRARYPNLNAPNGSWFTVPRRGLERPEGALNNYLGYIAEIGDRAKWQINVPHSGVYRIWLRYARKHTYAGSMTDRTAISIDGGQQVKLKNLVNTEGWDEFRWDLTGTIELSGGKRTLQWENVVGGGINLDAFCFTDDPNWQPALGKMNGNLSIPPVAEGKGRIVVQAETYSEIAAPKSQVISSQRYRIPLRLKNFPKWSDWSGAEVNAFYRYDYGNGIFPIEEIDRQNQCFFGDFTQSSYHVAAGSRFCIENVRSALNAPREWSLDPRKGELLYWSEDNTAPKEVVAPIMDRLIVLEGDRQTNSYVEHLMFRGLTFKDTDYTLAKNYFLPQDAAIWLKFARHCTIRNCHFSELGGHAIRLEDNSQHNRLNRNQIENLGQGGIVLAAENNDAQPHHNIIANNAIARCGRIYKHTAGIYVSTGSHNKIAHNQIRDLPRYGISLKSFGKYNRSHHNSIEFNHLENMCLETADTGAIETLGRDRLPSYNSIKFNLIRNTVGMGTDPEGKITTPYYSWGIYLDDFSSATTVRGNIIEGTVLGSVMIHGGKDNLVVNNIFIDGKVNQLQLTPEDDFMRDNIVRRNIFIYQGATARSIRASGPPWRRELLAECDFNVYWDDNLDPTSTASAFPEGNLFQWQAAGFDRHSVVANPLINRQEYSLATQSPALKLGFKPIPVKSIGIKGA